MNALEECHAKGFLWKAIGGCNNAKKDVVQCLRVERLKSQKFNRTEVEEKKAKIRQIWKDIDENS